MMSDYNTPWQLTETELSEHTYITFDIDDCNGESVCGIMCEKEDYDEMKSIARLIAKAPELKEELENVINMHNKAYMDALEFKKQRDKLLEKLKNLIYTSEKFWDEVKPIREKDKTQTSLTHPIIEEAKQIAKEIEKDNKMNR
jgi:hypothetical protein